MMMKKKLLKGVGAEHLMLKWHECFCECKPKRWWWKKNFWRGWGWSPELLGGGIHLWMRAFTSACLRLSAPIPWIGHPLQKRKRPPISRRLKKGFARKAVRVPISDPWDAEHWSYRPRNSRITRKSAYPNGDQWSFLRWPLGGYHGSFGQLRTRITRIDTNE